MRVSDKSRCFLVRILHSAQYALSEVSRQSTSRAAHMKCPLSK